MNLRQKVFLCIVIVVNVAVWLIPSNVAELVIRDKMVLFGRYSREHFSWNIAIAVISAVGLYIDQARSLQQYKRRWFGTIATTALLVPLLIVLDFFARYFVPPNYVHDGFAYRRLPDRRLTFRFDDLPAAALTRSDAPRGYPTCDSTFTTDQAGFRNRSRPAHSEIVTIGDSFTEGSNVSDEQVWPVLLEKRCGMSVYNLGVTGYSPLHYRAALAAYGLALKPRVVICTLYEGNDFRIGSKEVAAAARQSSGGLAAYVEESPIRRTLDGLMAMLAREVRVEADPAHAELLSWLPLRIPDGARGKYYAFGPKALLEHSESRQGFESGKYWRRSREPMEEIAALCRSSSARLIFVFAPTKAHVILPLVRDSLPEEKVHALASLATDQLPSVERFCDLLYENLDARESVVADWCRAQKVEFVSLTGSLRAAVAAGTQAYYTYDHHWTPEGNAIAARALAEYLQSTGADRSE